jgi:hypothetical protein
MDALVNQEEAYLRRVHPTPSDVPSCMSLLDDFLACNGPSRDSFEKPQSHVPIFAVLGFQFKSLYRYGHMSVCDRKLDDFKFCMSLKSLHPEEKRDAWIRRRAEWWANRRLSKSSEDVWEIRACVHPSLARLL